MILPSTLLLARTQSNTICLKLVGEDAKICAAFGFTAFSRTGFESSICSTRKCLCFKLNIGL